MSLSVSMEFLRYVAGCFAIDASLELQDQGAGSPHSGGLLMDFLRDAGDGRLDDDWVDTLKHLANSFDVPRDVAAWLRDEDHPDRVQCYALCTSVVSVAAQILAARGFGAADALNAYAEQWSKTKQPQQCACALLEGLEHRYGSLAQAMMDLVEKPTLH